MKENLKLEKRKEKEFIIIMMIIFEKEFKNGKIKWINYYNNGDKHERDFKNTKSPLLQ